jgi:hypothetical protein
MHGPMHIKFHGRVTFQSVKLTGSVLDSLRKCGSISGKNKMISYKKLSPKLGSTNLPSQILFGSLFLGVER